MPIAEADLLLFAAASRPVDDAGASGGAIDLDHRPEFTQLAAADQVEALSSAAGDTTQQVTVLGRLADGQQSTETLTLNGTTPVVFAATFERILRVTMDADATGTVTIRRDGAGAEVGVIPIGERGFTAHFIDSASDPDAVATRYEKQFWKNVHGTLALTNAEVELTVDPSARVEIGLAATKDDTASVANRLTAPGGITFVDDNVAQSVPTGALGAGEGIGDWIKQALLTADGPFNSSFTTRLSGTST